MHAYALSHVPDGVYLTPRRGKQRGGAAALPRVLLRSRHNGGKRGVGETEIKAATSVYIFGLL
jgi:hypothetical protein